MNFDLNENNPVIAVLGAGCMATAITRRIAAGKIILLGGISVSKIWKKQEMICVTVATRCIHRL